MPSVANVGGSITSALALTLLAWAVRFVRSAHTKRGTGRPAEAAQAHVKRGIYRAYLSPGAVQQLVGGQAGYRGKPRGLVWQLRRGHQCHQVETQPVPFCIFYVGADPAPDQLPACLNKSVSLPGTAPCCGELGLNTLEGSVAEQAR